MTSTLRVAQSHRLTLDSQARRSCWCRAVTRCAAVPISTLGARLRATRGGGLGYRSSGSMRFIASAVVDEAVSASEADSGVACFREDGGCR